jgi:hypothetical protein
MAFSSVCVLLCHFCCQVDFVKMLYDQMATLHTRFAETPRGINYPRPSFKVCKAVTCVLQQPRHRACALPWGRHDLLVCSRKGGVVTCRHVRSQQEWHWLPIRGGGQRPLSITKGNPSGSRGCHQTIPSKHPVQGRLCQQHQVHLPLNDIASKVQNRIGVCGQATWLLGHVATCICSSGK